MSKQSLIVTPLTPEQAEQLKDLIAAGYTFRNEVRNGRHRLVTVRPDRRKRVGNDSSNSA